MTRCDCPQPPGGFVGCSENQIAICRYNDGEFQAMCVDVPDDIHTMEQLKSTVRAASLQPESQGAAHIAFTKDLVAAVHPDPSIIMSTSRNSFFSQLQNQTFAPYISQVIQLLDDRTFEISPFIRITLNVPSRIKQQGMTNTA